MAEYFAAPGEGSRIWGGFVPDLPSWNSAMAIKVKERKGAWWLFIDHKGKRKVAALLGP